MKLEDQIVKSIESIRDSSNLLKWRNLITLLIEYTNIHGIETCNAKYKDQILDLTEYL